MRYIQTTEGLDKKVQVTVIFDGLNLAVASMKIPKILEKNIKDDTLILILFTDIII